MSIEDSRNLLLQPRQIEYLEEDTGGGLWRRFLSDDGQFYAEYTSHTTLFGLPLLHITWGRNPETLRRKTARGWIAIGRFACGVLAIGHVSFGMIAVGQAGFGMLFGLGQLTSGLFALGQFALGGIIGVGQFTTGCYALGQFGAGTYVIAQFGIGNHVWSMTQRDPLALQAFQPLFDLFR